MRRGKAALKGRPSNKWAVAQPAHAPRQPHLASIHADRGQPTVLANPAIKVMPVMAWRACSPEMGTSVEKGGSVRAAAQGHADEGPGCEQAPRPLRQGQSGQTSRENQAGHRQDHVTAMVVNRPPGPWSQWCGNQHRERKS